MKLKILSNITNYTTKMSSKHMLSVPTIKDITDTELFELTKKLKGDSEKETLTNILEWQDRNIKYWLERWTLPLTVIGLIIIICVIILGIFLIGFIVFVIWLYSLYNGTDAFLQLALLVALKNIIVTIVAMKGMIITFMFVLIIISAFYLLILKFTKFKNMEWKAIYYTCPIHRLPVSKILKYKLAICRDYARLTASLLFNIYPDSEVYFIRTKWHETVGMKLKNEIYVLDQHLPISTIDNYDENIEIYSSKKSLDGNRILKKEQKRTKKTKLCDINTEELKEKVATTLNIKQISHKNKPDFKICLEKYAKNYYYDDIIQHSLIIAIKNRLENEFCGNIYRISKINISQNNEDLMLEVCYD